VPYTHVINESLDRDAVSLGLICGGVEVMFSRIAKCSAASGKKAQTIA
jgi:hypothetical protein